MMLNIGPSLTLARSLLADISEGMSEETYVDLMWHIRDTRCGAMTAKGEWPIKRVVNAEKQSNVVGFPSA